MEGYRARLTDCTFNSCCGSNQRDMGNPSIRAPEVFAGTKMTLKQDVWSLAATAYEAMQGCKLIHETTDLKRSMEDFAELEPDALLRLANQREGLIERMPRKGGFDGKVATYIRRIVGNRLFHLLRDIEATQDTHPAGATLEDALHEGSPRARVMVEALVFSRLVAKVPSAYLHLFFKMLNVNPKKRQMPDKLLGHECISNITFSPQFGAGLDKIISRGEEDYYCGYD
jgi:serine/threonine protein kinase